MVTPRTEALTEESDRRSQFSLMNDELPPGMGGTSDPQSLGVPATRVSSGLTDYTDPPEVMMDEGTIGDGVSPEDAASNFFDPEVASSPTNGGRRQSVSSASAQQQASDVAEQARRKRARQNYTFCRIITTLLVAAGGILLFLVVGEDIQFWGNDGGNNASAASLGDDAASSTSGPSATPSSSPTKPVMDNSTLSPTPSPTDAPAVAMVDFRTPPTPTANPTMSPTKSPVKPTGSLESDDATVEPTYTPSSSPTTTPTLRPTLGNTAVPTMARTELPTMAPTPVLYDLDTLQLLDESLPINEGQVSVASSRFGDIVAVAEVGSNRVRVFQNVNATWMQYGDTISGTGDVSEQFGAHISLSRSGRILAIGSPGANNGLGRVSVYRYRTNRDLWRLQGPEFEGVSQNGNGNGNGGVNGNAGGNGNGNGNSGNDETGLGTAFDLSGNGLTIVIGEPLFNAGTGRVQMYRYDNDIREWLLLGFAIPEAETVLSPGDRAGSSVSISNDGMTVAVGAPGLDFGFSDVGAVTVFHYDMETDLTTVAAPAMLGVLDSQGLGRKVVLSNEGLNMAVLSGNGLLEVFVLSNGEWNSRNFPTNRGYSDVAIARASGAVNIVASYEDNGVAHVELLELRRRVWRPVGQDLAFPDVLGASALAIALSEDTDNVVIGLPGDVGLSRHTSVQVYSREDEAEA